MIIGTSEDGIVRQCEQCNAVYKRKSLPALRACGNEQE